MRVDSAIQEKRIPQRNKKHLNVAVENNPPSAPNSRCFQGIV
jgi:hypothetical protein